MKNLFEKILFRQAQAILAKYKPEIIGITGSIGKTSTKEAAYAVLNSKFQVRRNEKNFNNEFGLPLTIIGAQESPKKNPFKWLALFTKASWISIFHSHYPKVLILEMGVDRPGDMDKLVDLAHPHVAVLTSAGVSHMEYFGSQEGVLREKKKIFKHLTPKDYAVLNIDEPHIKSLMPQIKSRIITYGFDPLADVCVRDYSVSYSNKKHSFGTLAHLQHKGQIVPIYLNGIIGLPHVQACAAGAAIGLAFGMTLNEISHALEHYHSQPGRMQIIPGIKNSAIIDDTYNAAPQSMQAALKELADFPAQHKIVALGDMLELGTISNEEHTRIAEHLMKMPVDQIILVGEKMQLAVNTLQRNNFPLDRLFYFEKSKDAIDRIKELIKDHSAILVKGSQGMRMERIVKGAMLEPHRAKELLCRQDKDWLKKP